MKQISQKILFIVFSMLLISTLGFSQKNKQTPNYSKHPYWIDMMNDPNANYFETVKAYNDFWANRKKPTEEDDIIGQDKSASEKQNFLQRFFRSKEEREEEEVRKYKMDVKKFKHWQLKVKPYVQEDGRILSADEQLKLWQEQKK